MNDQNNIPGDIHSLLPWFSVIRHVRAAGKSGGLSVIRMTVIVDEISNPVLFGQPEVIRLYPKDNARDAINELIGKMMGKGDGNIT